MSVNNNISLVPSLGNNTSTENSCVRTRRTPKGHTTSRKNKKKKRIPIHQLNVRIDATLRDEFRKIVADRKCTDRVALEEAIKWLVRKYRRNASTIHDK